MNNMERDTCNIEARSERERRAYTPEAILGLWAACRKLPGFVCAELLREGVSKTTLEKLSMRYGNIMEIGANRFEFAHLCRSCWGNEGKPAIVMPAYDLQGDVVDLAAWDLETNRISTLCGLAWALGEDTVFAPRLSEGLPVHRMPLGWLQDGGKGIVILNPAKARNYLIDAGPLVAENQKHRRELTAALVYPLPRILVAPAAKTPKEG